MKIKIRKSDKLFSLYIRKRDNWTCKKCHTQHPENSQGLHCSHFYGRAGESTRFDDENCDAICFGCHQYFHGEPNEYVEWKKKQLGTKRFNALTIRAKATFKKRDDKMDAIVVQAMLDNL